MLIILPLNLMELSFEKNHNQRKDPCLCASEGFVTSASPFLELSEEFLFCTKQALTFQKKKYLPLSVTKQEIITKILASRIAQLFFQLCVKFLV